MDSEYVEKLFEFMLTQITQTKVHSCEVFNYFAIAAIKNTIWRCFDKL